MNLIDLKVSRIRRGLKQMQIDDALGKYHGWYHNVENGHIQMTAQDLSGIARCMSLSPEEVSSIVIGDADVAS